MTDGDIWDAIIIGSGMGGMAAHLAAVLDVVVIVDGAVFQRFVCWVRHGFSPWFVESRLGQTLILCLKKPFRVA